jgi:hypothetical protein
VMLLMRLLKIKKNFVGSVVINKNFAFPSNKAFQSPDQQYNKDCAKAKKLLTSWWKYRFLVDHHRLDEIFYIFNNCIGSITVDLVNKLIIGFLFV